MPSGLKKLLTAPHGIHNSEYTSWNLCPNYPILVYLLSMVFHFLTSDHTCLSRLICHSFLPSPQPPVFKSLQTACHPCKTGALPYLLTLINAIPKVLNVCPPFIMETKIGPTNFTSAKPAQLPALELWFFYIHCFLLCFPTAFG